MAQLTLKSKQQLLGDMFKSILSSLDLNDINRASFIRTILEAVAVEQFQHYIEMVKVLQTVDLNSRKRADLDKTGTEFNLPRIEATKASGPISILRDASFVKVSTTFYSGLPAPVQGNTKLYVNNASSLLYGTSGTLIIGRGTSNEEEVTYSSAPINNTNYWTFTVSALTKNHGREESVILKQGSDETIYAGTVIAIPASGSSAAVNFVVEQDTILLAGEAQIENVSIKATEPGANGNIPIKAINVDSEVFSPAPFVGARAQNLTKFSTGSNRESDDSYRDRIKRRIQALSKGTKTAILNEIIGLVNPNTAKRVVSANVILPTTLDDWVRIYIDDGTGLEPDFIYIGGEILLNSANGGEERLQLDLVPVVKAFAENNIAEPYNISALGNSVLQVQVGLAQESIPFNIGSFSFPEAATAEEVAGNINNNSITLEARTSNGGKNVVITAKSDSNEDIQVLSGGTNNLLGFPIDKRSTIYTYKNDELLSKDGSTAFIDTAMQPFNFAGAGPWTLTLVIDGKTANPQTVTFSASDFNTPATATASEVKAVIDAQLVGAETTLISNSSALRIISLTKLSSNSAIEITGGSAQAILGLSGTPVIGTDNDYTFNPQTGTFQFNSPLATSDNISIGSEFTRGKLRSSQAEPYQFVSNQTIVFEVEGVSQPVITFTSGNYTAQQAADLINNGTEGITAISREVGSQNFLEVYTNTFEEGVGTIKVSNITNGAALFLGLPINVLKTSQRPHKAFVVSQNAGPFSFFEGDNLVVVMDNNPALKTFTVTMDYDGSVSSAVNGQIFSDSTLINIFQDTDILKDFRLVASSGANTASIDILDVIDQGGDTWRFTFDSIPANFGDFSVGDVFATSGMTQSGNNGTFLITAKDDTPSSEYIEITNVNGASELNSSGSAEIKALRIVNLYDKNTGKITLVSALPQTPSVSDTFSLLPVTVTNLEYYMNNLRITTLGSKAEILSVEGNTKIQISSKENGSDGFVQITGGTANVELDFDTNIIVGLQGYAQNVGLIETVHKAIYGDDGSIEGVGAAGIRFEIKAPTKEEVSFNIDVTLKEGISISTVEDEVKSAVTGYVNSLGIGDDLILAEIIEKIMSVSGIVDVDIITPETNVNIQENEVARTNDSLITVG